MTLYCYTFMHRITAAAGPESIQAGPGFVVLLFFFMARLKAFKALGACHPCNYTLNTFKRLLKASRRFLAAVIELYQTTARPDPDNKRMLQHSRLFPGFLCCLVFVLYHHTRRPGRPSMVLYNIVTYDHMSIYNIDFVRRKLSIDIFCRKNLGCVSDFSF